MPHHGSNHHQGATPSSAWQALPAPPLLGSIDESSLVARPGFLGVEIASDDMPMLLAALARLVGPGREIFCADGCNRFDPYRFSEWARRSGLDPRDVLNRVFLSRAFTIHQMAALARDLTPSLAERQPRPLVVVLGLEALFLDEQVPRHERAHLFRASLAGFVSLRDAGVPVMATMSPERESRGGVPSRRAWARLLADAADRMVRVRRLAEGSIVFETITAPHAPAPVLPPPPPGRVLDTSPAPEPPLTPR